MAIVEVCVDGVQIGFAQNPQKKKWHGETNSFVCCYTDHKRPESWDLIHGPIFYMKRAIWLS
jgi:hypothetical protein